MSWDRFINPPIIVLGSLLLSLESIDYKPTEDQEMVFEEEDEGLLLVEYS